MTTGVRRRKIDSEFEVNVLGYLVHNDTFLSRCASILEQVDRKRGQAAFENTDINKISAWCMVYYRKYKKSPGKFIKEIFHSNAGSMSKEEQDITWDIIKKIDSETFCDSRVNIDYILDKTIDYFKIRLLKILGDTLVACSDAGNLDSAESALVDFRRIEKASANFVNIFATEEIKKYFDDRNDKTNVLFRFPGALGDMIGDFERGWLVSFLGPPKRGKTFWLQETAFQALLNGFKVIFISLEMDAFGMKKRFYKRITARADAAGDFIYPVFDCLRNQDDSCKKKQRSGFGKIEGQVTEEGFARDAYNHKVCTECRNNNKQRDFIQAIWYEKVSKPEMKKSSTINLFSSLDKPFRENFRFGSYPSFSANLSEIKSDIDQLEQVDNFIPDVIILDYADILAPEDTRQVGRERIDDTWKALKNIASTRHALVVTASQSNRSSIDKQFVTQVHVAEDIRKLAHVDLMLVINQQRMEKKMKTVRIGVVAGRESDFDQQKSVQVLQNVALGQVILDSEPYSDYEHRGVELFDSKKNNK